MTERIIFDLSAQAVQYGEIKAPLRHREALIFDAILRRGGNVVTAVEIQAELWGPEHRGAGVGTVQQFIGSMREQFDDLGIPPCISTVPKRGYVIGAQVCVGTVTAVPIVADRRLDEWPPEKIDQLRELWLAGYVSAEIGRRLGISKSAAIAKARRIGLPGRGSPIRVSLTPKEPKFKRPADSRRTKLRVVKPVKPLKPRPEPKAAVPRPEPKTAPTIAPPRVDPRSPCCWPFGDPGTPEFRFCGDPAIFSKPYCPTHHRIAYVRIPVAHDDDAPTGGFVFGRTSEAA